MHWRGGTELHVEAQVVYPGLAVLTLSTGNTRFNGDSVTNFDFRDELPLLHGIKGMR